MHEGERYTVEETEKVTREDRERMKEGCEKDEYTKTDGMVYDY